MHESSIKNIMRWYGAHFSMLTGKPIAELGSYDINGSIKDFIPEEIIGFDICEGPKVDIVLTPGEVPDTYKGIYKAVISANAFHLCGEPEKYKREVVDLLEKFGLFVITMCKPDCECSHNTSPNKYGYRDGIRMQPEELVKFWDDAFICERVYIEGHDLVYWGTKK